MISADSSPDEELIAAARGGDTRAFGELVARHAPFVCALACSLSGSEREGDEIAHETFVTAWRSLPRLRKPGSLRPWLWGITRNVTLKFEERRARRRTQRRLEQGNAGDDAVPPSPLETVIRREEEAAVERALQRVPETYRVPLLLHYWEQWSIKEVADALGIREDNVRQRLARGRRLIQGGLVPAPELASRRARSRDRLAGAVMAALVARRGASADASSKVSPGSVWLHGSVSLAIPATLAVVALSFVHFRDGTGKRAGAPALSRPSSGRPRLAALATASPLPAPRAQTGDTPTTSTAAAPILDFDFEDGVLPPSFILGHVGPCPARAGNTGCVTSGVLLESYEGGYAGLLVGVQNPEGLFRHSGGLTLSFDYWVISAPETGAIQLSNQTQPGQFYVELPLARPGVWNHMTLPLSFARRHTTKQPIAEGDLITALYFSLAEGASGPPFYVDNIRLIDQR